MSYVPDVLGSYGSYVPPVVGGLGYGGLGASYVPAPSFGGFGLGAGACAGFGFGGAYNVPGQIYEQKEYVQQHLNNRAHMAHEQAGAILAAQAHNIDRQCDHQIYTHNAQTNARRQAAKLQAQNQYQQTEAAIQRGHMQHHTTTEQRYQQAATQAAQHINACEHRAQQYYLTHQAQAQHASAMANHAANIAASHAYGYAGAGFGYSGLGGYGGYMGGYGGYLGGYGAYGGF